MKKQDMPRHAARRPSLAEIKRDCEDDVREDMAIDRFRRFAEQQRFLNQLAGRGPDGEGLGYAG